MARWNIRPATARDAPALADCIDAAYAPYRDRIKDLPAVSEGIAETIGTDPVFIAELDRSVVGGVILQVQDDCAILTNVAVDPEFAGMGIGRGLIEHAVAEARQSKKRELRLSTHVDMPRNVRLYEHLGWVETGRSGNKVHMTKTL